jgi:hypothetical protein
MSFSAEFAQEILKRVNGGQSPEDVAKHLGRTPDTIRDWLRVTGHEVAERPHGSAFKRAWKSGHEFVASLFGWRESRYAADVSRELLKLYWIVTASQPGLSRREIYKHVVMARTGADAADAELVLMRAEQSFASWPSERDLTFNDVVHYLAVSEYLATGDRMATNIDMGRLIARRLPKNL